MIADHLSGNRRRQAINVERDIVFRFAVVHAVHGIVAEGVLAIGQAAHRNFLFLDRLEILLVKPRQNGGHARQRVAAGNTEFGLR